MLHGWKETGVNYLNDTKSRIELMKLIDSTLEKTATAS